MTPLGDDEPGGGPVCWLHRLCPVCGAVPSPESPGRCWRCGTADPDEPGTATPVPDGDGN